MLFLIGGTLAFFFEFMLLGKKEKSLSDKLLGIWMFFIGLHLLMYYFLYSGLAINFPFIIGISAAFPFLHGPFLYLYTSALTKRMIRWKSVMFLHFLPVLFFYGYNVEFFFMTREAQWNFVQQIMAHEGSVFFDISTYAILASAVTYQILTLALFRLHKRNIRDNFSYQNEKISLNWLRYLIIGMSVIWVAVIVNNLQLTNLNGDDLIYVTVFLFVVFIGFFGVRQGNIFVTLPASSEHQQSEDQQFASGMRYVKSGLKKEVADETQKSLMELMEKDKLYLDDNLTLGKIAEKVNLSPTYLSQVINERFGKNFYDFVNTFRIEEFKRILTHDPVKKNYSILSLAYEVGFNSKSSFNKYFKQSNGITPSEYIKSIS